MLKDLPTRDDVAAKVGVSPVTVSRCFTNPDSVSPKRRQLILQAAEELGYHPNRGASVLRSSGTGRIVLIERQLREGKEWERNHAYDFLFKATYQGVLKGLAETMYSLTYLPVKSDEELRKALVRLPADGILGMNFEDPDEIQPIVESGLPYLLSHNTKALDGFNRCYTDNYQGGYLVGSFLRDTGHTRVAYVTFNTSTIETHRERWQGFRDGVGERHVADLIDLSVRGREGGILGAKRILAAMKGGQNFDAVGVVNDETAVSLVQALMAEGVRIPEDLSIVGYDDNPQADFLPFHLASVNLNLESVYHIAVTSLLKVIRSGEPIHRGIAPLLHKGNSVLDRT